ncbi:MAG: SpoIIE family protein phosphatase [Planctomycetota bacterium]|jgi:sigma-B regulation protein RsbU (phosphoserine phosphatase)
MIRSITSKLPIKVTMPVLLALPVVVVAAVLSLVAFVQGRSAADDLATQNMNQIHSRIEEHLSKLMDMPPAINTLNKRMLATGELSLVDVARNRIPVHDTLKVFPAVSSALICKATGETMWVIRYPREPTYEYAIKPAPKATMKEYTLGDRGQIISECLSEYAWFPTGRPWYIDAVEAKEPTWGRIYVWLREGKAETLGIPYTEPLWDDGGNVAGVIICEMTLADISVYLQRLEIGKTGKAFILERNGDLVATSVGIRCMKDGVKRLPAAESPDTWIAQASRELTSRFKSLGEISGRSRIEVQIDGEPMRLVVSPYTNRRNLSWLIVTLVPESDFMARVNAGRRHSIIIGVSAIVATVLLGMVLAMLIVRPFLSLVSQLRRIGGGDVEHEVHLDQTPEFTQLSTEINAMTDGLRDRMRMRQSLALAMDVQQNLLPSTTPQVEGLDIAGHSIYCDETGGDYYDFLEVTGLSRTTAVIALGDVTGHGVAAAMLMATARGILRSRSQEPGSLADLLTHMNDLLVNDTGAERFMTMFLMTIDASRGEMRWSSAGHDPPFIYDAETDTLAEPEGGAVPLGILAGADYEEYASTDVRAGQIYLAATDGVWETFNEGREPFGKERLRKLIRDNAHRSAAEISTELREQLNHFRGGGSQDDDVTFVIVKVQ